MSNPSKYVSRSVRTAYFASIVGLTLVLMVFGILSWALLNANELRNTIRETAEMEIFMFNQASEGDKIRLEKSIMALPFVKSANKVSSKEAIEVLETEEQGFEDISEFIEEDVIPPSIRINVKADYVSVDTLDRYKNYIASNYSDVVLDVHYNKDRVAALEKNLNKPVLLIVIVSGLLLFIAVALIHNTIRLAIYSNRFSLKTMTLVGASSSYIRRPYLMNSIIQGLIAGLLALGLLIGFVYVLTQFQIISLNSVQLIEPKLFLYIFGILMVLGTGISFISTFFALRKYIRIKTDNLY